MRTSKDSPHSSSDSCGCSTWEDETGRWTKYRRGYFVERFRQEYPCRTAPVLLERVPCLPTYSIASVQSISEEDEADESPTPDLGAV